MVKHLAQIAGITLLIALCILRPFLPGDYDGLAMPISTMAQAFGVVGQLLVPVGGLWLVYEIRNRARRKQNLPVKSHRFYFALVSVITASLVAAILSLIGVVTSGLSLGLLALELWMYAVIKLLPGLKALRKDESEHFHPVPLYLIILPLATLFSQLMLAAPLTESSRNRAIAMSAEFIQDIEAYRTANGHYPVSLQGTWKDYYPDVVGVEKYHYDANGEAYNLFFEQPRFLLDNIGTREFVVYNPLDKHKIISHTSWILLLSPTELETSQGWYEVHDTSSPHWKYFWFD